MANGRDGVGLLFPGSPLLFGGVGDLHCRRKDWLDSYPLRQLKSSPARMTFSAVHEVHHDFRVFS